MRKVFLSTMLIGNNRPTKYVSQDFAVDGKNYAFPLSYILDGAVEEGDHICVVTAVNHGKEGTTNKAEENYRTYQEEVKQIVTDRKVDLEFVEIPIPAELNDQSSSSIFNAFFKKITEQIQDDDRLYCDVTFNLKPYSISMFVALAYGAKAVKDVKVENLIYAQKFTGAEKDGQRVDTSCIYDITGLFYLNELASHAEPGQREGMDELLKFIINE